MPEAMAPAIDTGMALAESVAVPPPAETQASCPGQLRASPLAGTSVRCRAHACPRQSRSAIRLDAGLPRAVAPGAAVWGTITLPPIHSGSLRLIHEQFAELDQANPDAVLKLAADGSLICMPPTGSDTGARNSELDSQIKS